MGSPESARFAYRARRAVAVGTVVAALVAASACGGGSADEGTGPVTVTMSHGYTDAEATQLTAQVEEWNAAHPDQTVQLVFNGGNDFALQKVVAGFTAGNYPDISYQYGSSAAQLAKQPKLVDLTDKVTAPEVNWNDFYPGERQAATVNGKVVGLPALVDNLSLVYNTKLFRQAGVPEPTADWTWQQFRDAARKLTDPSTKTYGWSYVNDGSEDTVWRFLALLWQAGGDLLTADNTKPAFDSPAGLAALTQLQAMAVTDKSVYLDPGNQNYLNLFNGNKIAMLWTGPWDLSAIDDKIDYGVTYLPGYNGNHETVSGPDVYLMFDQSDRRADAAWAFLTWLTSAEVHLRFSIATGDLPLRASETKLPDYAKYLKAYPAQEVFVDNLNNVKHVRPNIASYGEVSTAVGQMVQSVMIGKAQPAQALKAAREQVTSVLAGS